MAQRCAASHPHGFWHPQGAGWLTSPVQVRWRCCFTLRTATWVCLQPPYLGGLQIVAIVVLRQRDGRGTVAHGMLGQAVYQFTAAAADHDAFRRHAVKSRQLRTYIGVVRVRVLRCAPLAAPARLLGMARRHCGWWKSHARARPARRCRHAPSGCFQTASPTHGHRIIAIKTIASNVSKTCTPTTLEAKPTARCTSVACGARPCGLSWYTPGFDRRTPAPAPWPPWASRRWAKASPPHRAAAQARRCRVPPAPATLP